MLWRPPTRTWGGMNNCRICVHGQSVDLIVSNLWHLAWTLPALSAKSGRKHSPWLCSKSGKMSCVGNHCHKQAFATVWTSLDTPQSIPQTSLIKNEEGTSCNWAMALACSVFFLSAICLYRFAVAHCSLCFLMWGSIVPNHRKIMIPRFHAEMSVWRNEVGARYLLWHLRGLDIYQPDTFVSTVGEVDGDTHCDWKTYTQKHTRNYIKALFRTNRKYSRHPGSAVRSGGPCAVIIVSLFQSLSQKFKLNPEQRV